MSQLFYSQVNSAVQSELVARGSVRTKNNSNAALDFMLGKIANVELQAYDAVPTAESKPIEGFGTLGGFTVLNGSYKSTGPNGFLNDKIRPSFRIPPIINGLSVSVNDQSKMFINKANISIKILDATTDLEEMERIYCAPGRYVRLKIVYPDSAVLSGNTLADATNTLLPTTEQLKTLFPGVELENLRKLNEYYFSGRVSTFNYSYLEDGTIELTVEAIGTTNTYLDVNATIAQTTGKDETGTKPTNQVDNLYTLLLNEITAIESKFKQENKPEFEYLEPNSTEKSILVGIPYKNQNANTPSTSRMVSIGYFIDFINKKFMEKVGAKIICMDAICKSNNFYNKLVSADPVNILLWSGTSNSKTDSYYFDASEDAANNSSIADAYGVEPVDQPLKFFPSVKPQSQGFLAQDGNAYPARIYVNIEVIRSIVTEIEKTEPTIKQLLTKLSKIIQTNTGNAIKMVAVQDPLVESALLYTDSNYVDITTTVDPFSLPAWPGLTGRTAVRNFTLTTNVPNTVKNMIFGVNSLETGTQKQVAYNAYIYANQETKTKLQEEWRTTFKNTRNDLAVNKNDIALKPIDEQAIEKLQKTLAMYVTYFTDDITKSINYTKAFFPMNLEFTIDGINGLKYGDILQFDGIPRRYTDSYVFMIVGITHTVTETGDWTTVVTCNPRVRTL